MLETLPEKIEDARKLALPTAPPHAAAASLNSPARPVFVGLDPEHDAIAPLVRCFNPTGATANVAVVHLRSVRERTELGNKLRSADHAAGGSKLPVVVISPKGNIELDDNVKIGRDVRHLAMPLHPKDLIRQLAKLAQPRHQAA